MVATDGPGASFSAFCGAVEEGIAVVMDETGAWASFDCVAFILVVAIAVGWLEGWV